MSLCLLSTDLWVHLVRPQVQTVTADFDSGLIFEQDPVAIIDALLPLYLNATLLRALQVPAPAPAQSSSGPPLPFLLAGSRARCAILLLPRSTRM